MIKVLPSTVLWVYRPKSEAMAFFSFVIATATPFSSRAIGSLGGCLILYS